MNTIKKISIIIPVYNEGRTVYKIVQDIENLKIPRVQKEIILVDDASTDKTNAQILKLQKVYRNIVVISHKINSGKGAAFATGLTKTTGDVIVIQDADLEYPAINILTILEPIILKRASVVFGSRKLSRETRYSSYLYYVGGAILDIIIKKSLLTNISDPLCGPKAFKKSVFKKIGKIKSKGFEIDTELTAKISNEKIEIVEVPIVYKPRTHAQGKKIRWYDSFRILTVLALSKLRS